MKQKKNFSRPITDRPVLVSIISLLLAAGTAILLMIFLSHTEFVTACRVICCGFGIGWLIVGAKKDSDDVRKKTKTQKFFSAYMTGCIVLIIGFVFLTFTYNPLPEAISGEAWPAARNSDVMYIITAVVGAVAFGIKLKKD